MIKNLISILTKNQKKKIILIIIFAIILMILETLTLSSFYPISQILLNDSYIVVIRDKFYLENFNNNELYLILILSISLIFILKVISSIFINNFQYSTIYKIQNDITEKLFTKYSKQDLNFHIVNDSSKLIRNLTSEINQYILGLLSLTVLIQEGLIIVGLMSLMAFISLKLFLILILFISIIFTIYFSFFKKKIVNWGINRQTSEGNRIQFIKEFLQNFKELKIYNLENFFLKKLKNANLVFADSLKKIKLLQKIPTLIIEFSIFSLILIFVYLSFLGKLDVNSLSIISVFLISAVRIISPLNRCAQSLQHLRYSNKAIEVIIKDLNFVKEKDINKNEFNYDFFDKKNIKINIENLTLKRGDKYLFKNLNFEFTKNDIIGIKGKSGSGKTTFANIISGLVEPTSGKVLCNGYDILIYTNSWQRLISYVSQETFIFNDTLKNNLIFEGQVSEKKIIEHINHFNLNKLYQRLNDINLSLGESGIKISGGERQRLSFIRAILKEPKILILDEATSALDKKNTDIIIKFLIANKKNYITFIISHENDLFKICNKVINFEK